MLIRDADDERGGPADRGVHAPPQPGLGVRGRRLRLPRWVGRSRGPRTGGGGPVPGTDRRRGQRHPGHRVGRAGLLGGGPAGVLRGGRRAGGPTGRRRRRRARARCSTPATPRWPGASPPTGMRSTSSAPGCSTSADAEDLVLAADTVHYVSHWITPELAPRRYDTRFFITAAPRARSPATTTGRPSPPSGSGPAEALARQAAGEIELLPPTIANLRSLEAVPLDRRGDGLGQSGHRRARPCCPSSSSRTATCWSCGPGDEGYEEALADRLASGPEVDQALCRRRPRRSGARRPDRPEPIGRPGTA